MSAQREADDERLRLFVALELPEPVRSTLVTWTAGAVPRPHGLRVLEDGALHVTLCFLGWQSPAAVDGIGQALRGLGQAPAAGLSLAGARWLPARRPRVLAVELCDPTGALRGVQSKLSRTLSEGGWYQPETRPYLPHVTVARVAHGARVSPRPLSPPPASAFCGRRVTLFRSRLRATGARYEPLAGVELGAAAGGDAVRGDARQPSST